MTSECSDIGDISDVTPFTIFKDNPSNLDFDKNSFTCGSINLNSILHANRLDQVQTILRDNNFSVFCINESKLDENKDPACYKIDKYIAYAPLHAFTTDYGIFIVFVCFGIIHIQKLMFTWLWVWVKFQQPYSKN